MFSLHDRFSEFSLAIGSPRAVKFVCVATMADPDIRRMGKKHKKHKKEYSQYHNIRLPGEFIIVKLFGLKAHCFDAH